MKNWVSKVIRGFIVLVICLLTFRGIYGIFNSPSEKMVYEALEVSQKVLVEDVKETVDVGNIAELIAMETMTYSKSDETYHSRLNAFGFPIDTDSHSLKSPAIAKSAKAVSVEKLNDTQFNVSVQVLVEYPDLDSSSMIGLNVPIYKSEDSLRLDGYTLIESVKKIEVEKPTPFGLKVLEDEMLSKEIVLQTENFLKNYYEGTQSELSVYLVDSQTSDIVALEGRVTLVPQKTEINVYPLEGGQYLSLVNAKVLDSNGVEVVQKLQVIVEKKNDKYLIVSMAPRVQNINEMYNIKEKE